MLSCLYDAVEASIVTECKLKFMNGARVLSDHSVMMGKPVIAGTRITVELIIEKLAAGESAEEILSAHPHLPKDAIRVALAFAAEALKADVVYPAETHA